MDPDKQTYWTAAEEYEQQFRELRHYQDRPTQREGNLEGRESIHLKLLGLRVSVSETEYRILQALSTRPYSPFSRKEIVEAVNMNQVNSTGPLLTEESVDQHIKSLRDKLDFYSDFIQTVPYIGYRLKP